MNPQFIIILLLFVFGMIAIIGSIVIMSYVKNSSPIGNIYKPKSSQLTMVFGCLFIMGILLAVFVYMGVYGL